MVLASFAVIYVGAIYGIQFSQTYVVILLSFLASDAMASFFVRGQEGIMLIRGLGHRVRVKAINFVAFFVLIILGAIVVDLFSQWLLTQITPYFSQAFPALGIGATLTILVYLDMNAKYYSRSE
jgi:hypothetical protein